MELSRTTTADLTAVDRSTLRSRLSHRLGNRRGVTVELAIAKPVKLATVLPDAPVEGSVHADDEVEVIYLFHAARFASAAAGSQPAYTFAARHDPNAQTTVCAFGRSP